MMQKGMRVNESQLNHLAQKAKKENCLCGYLFKKSNDTGKWQMRWFALYQNLLFYYDNESASRASGVCLLEGCFCERVVTPTTKTGEKQVRVACVWHVRVSCACGRYVKRVCRCLYLSFSLFAVLQIQSV